MRSRTYWLMRFPTVSQRLALFDAKEMGQARGFFLRRWKSELKVDPLQFVEFGLSENLEQG